MRVGTGYDIHRIKPSGKLRLGGLQLEHNCSLEGHSDGDVVMHAVCDALLGAAAMGDIGMHFPDTCPDLKGADSSVFLRNVSEMLEEAGYRVVNLDITLILEKPLMAPYRESMVKRVSEIIGIDKKRVNIKFKTAEGLGAEGSGEAASCHAVALIDGLKKGG